MGRDLRIHPLHHPLKETNLLWAMLPCFRESGFLTQLNLYDGPLESYPEIPVAIEPRPLPNNKLLFEVDMDTPISNDRIGPVQYCTAGEFGKIDLQHVRHPWNKAVVAFCLALPPKNAVIIWIS